MGKVVSCDEVIQVCLHLLMVVIVVAANCGVLDGAVHALDLAIGPGVIRLRQAVFDTVARANAVERVTAEPLPWVHHGSSAGRQTGFRCR